MSTVQTLAGFLVFFAAIGLADFLKEINFDGLGNSNPGATFDHGDVVAGDLAQVHSVSTPRQPNFSSLAAYGAKYPERSKISCVGLVANALTHPLLVGGIAIFEVIAPSSAFKVETTGIICPFGHRVR
jgi:hypothetical protein